jgi:hypothetical protein
LINSDVSPRLSKSALLALVKWVVKKREKGELLENNGMGFNPQGIPHSIDQSIGSNGCKKIKNEFNRGGNDL